MLFLPGVNRPGNTPTNARLVQLQADPATEHVVSNGHAFVVRMRGTGSVIGKHVMLSMLVDSGGRPLGVSIENEDGRKEAPAIGDWIDISSIAVVRLP